MTIDRVIREFTDVGSAAAFDEMAQVALAYQYAHTAAYRRYCDALRTPAARRALTPRSRRALAPRSRRALAPRARNAAPAGAPVFSRQPAFVSPAGLPVFLPVAAFKQVPVTAFPPEEAETIFESSGTGSGLRSRHYVRDVSMYERALAANFSRVFGTGPFLFALCLPGYAEQGASSSLAYMADFLLRRFGAAGSASVLGAPERLRRLAEQSANDDIPLLLFGAAFGLLDLAETASFSLPAHTIVVETGGMKTRRREMSRAELHGCLREGFGVSSVCSEYGMCELLGSCYAREGGVFYPPPWTRYWIVDPARPFEPLEEGREGALALLDLANLYSASALLTEDRAVQRGNGFEVLGRLAGAEPRGCNFLLEDV